MLSLLFSFKGRANRAQYWLGNLGVGFAGGFALAFLFMLSGASFADAKADPAGALKALTSLMLFSSLIMLAMSWCGFAIQVKRFHDRGQSGWFAMLPFVPVIGITFTLFTGVMSGTPAPQIAGQLQGYFLFLMLINFGFFINLGLLGGTNGPNKYGDPPGGPSSYMPQAPRTDAPANTGLGILGGAEQAIDRAIAEAARQPQAPRPQPVRVVAPQPAMARASAGAPAFGRRPAR